MSELLTKPAAEMTDEELVSASQELNAALAAADQAHHDTKEPLGAQLIAVRAEAFSRNNLAVD